MNEHLSRVSNACRVKHQVGIPKLRGNQRYLCRGLHILKVAYSWYRVSQTYLGGMLVFKYSSRRLTSARGKSFFSVNRKGTLHASTRRRRTPALRKGKSVPLTWRNKMSSAVIVAAGRSLGWLVLPAPSNPWFRLYFKDSSYVLYLFFPSNVWNCTCVPLNSAYRLCFDLCW